ncbi:MAG: hypothetical protein U0936_02045 [Planctomycetaceae bacterium]
MTITHGVCNAVPDDHRAVDFAWRAGSILNINTDELYRRLIDNKDKQFL